MDNYTGLIWLNNADCTDTAGGISKSSGLLSSANALTWSNNLASGLCSLTDGSTAGQWRLPNINELRSLGPIWPPGSPFTSVHASNYWSSNSYASYTDYAWIISMYDGGVFYSNKSYYFYYVWPVRAGQ